MNFENTAKSRFRFTLRESLIAMVALAALLALAVKSHEQAQPFAPTGFFESFDGAMAKTMVTASGQQLGIAVNPPGAGQSESTGGRSASREIRLAVAVPGEQVAKVFVLMQRKLRQMLEDDGCFVASSGSASEASGGNITHFSYDYEKGTNRGHVFVYRVPTQSGTWEVAVLIHEFRRPR